MKKLLLLVAALALCASAVSAQSMTWSPTPLVITAAPAVQYDFDGTDVQIPFSTSGKNALVWLVIESKLDEEDKPVALFNGYKNWHFVNGIDTTIYVSTSQAVEPGTGHFFIWNGYGNEKEYDVLEPNAEPMPDPGVNGYTYYLWGYDNQSPRELANDFITIGSFWEGQYARFYVNDDQGVPYPTPKLMGTQNYNALNGTPFGRGDIFKWDMGNDPVNTELVVISTMGEPYDAQEEGGWVGYGPGVFDPQDHDVFFFVKNRWWQQNQTVVKYQFVAGGEAQQDLSWGDLDNVYYFHPGNKQNDTIRSGLLAYQEDYLLMLDGGQNPLTYPHEYFHILDKADPTLPYWEGQLSEFYMPDQPPNGGAGDPRTASEINRFNWGPGEGNVIITGDWTCLMECISVSRMIELGASEAYAGDGTGWVTWRNSNGDFFMDAGSEPATTPEEAYLNWACIVSDPRNPNFPREETSDADMNGFMVSFLDYCGTNAIAVYCPDGSGIEQMKFFDDDRFSGGDNRAKRGAGETLDYGGTYDGLYMQDALGSGDYAGNGTNWIAFDSDSGVIKKEVEPAVEEGAPAAFTVAQNSPNPFNPTTTINYNLAQSGQVSIDVYNVAGQKVDTLVNDFMTAGSHSVVWDATDVAAGMYFYTVKAGDRVETKKMTLLK
jgi:hypothetical protein